LVVAVRRCGELLKQIPDGKGINQHTEHREGALPTRTEAATEAGLSERQRKTARRGDKSRSFAAIFNQIQL